MDNRYFEDAQTESPHQGTSQSTEVTAPQEDDSESHTTGNMEIQVLIFPKPKLKETLEVAHEHFRV